MSSPDNSDSAPVALPPDDTTGVNPVTGDYSRGAAGFWVEGGEIVHPVSEITIAGNLLQMFAAIGGVADDARPCHRYRLGSTLIEAMQVAGD